MPAGRIQTKHLTDGVAYSGGAFTQNAGAGINARKFTLNLLKGQYAFERGDHTPQATTAANAYGAPTGSAGDTNTIQFRRGLTSIFYVRVGQTLLAPLVDSVKGLDLSQDQTNTRGVEHVFGGTVGIANPFAMTIGTDNFFIRAKFRLEAILGTAHCLFGWRKNAAFNATALTNYTDFVGININVGNPEVKTNVGGGGVVTTSPSPAPTIWANTETHEVMIKVAGQTPTYYYDGVPLRGIPAYTWTAATVVLPFFSFLQNATTTNVFLNEIEIGRLSDINQSGLNA